jgi:decaprenylphospho-beta-D-ribofuranose 2-oxidase
MSPDAPDRALAELPGDDALLAGWGNTAPSAARVVHPLDDEDVRRLVEVAPPRGVVARGMGRAYGDAAQNSGGLVLDATSLTGIRHADLDRGLVTVGAGTSFEELMRWLLPRGWFVPVSPGTRQITVGGAIACDIHGKGHHTDGSFGDHVHSLVLQTGAGEVRTLTPRDTPEEFWATIGGMGLTGVVLEATFDLIPVETSFIMVDTERAKDLDDLMGRMEARDQEYRYAAAWIDCVARGSSLGRGVLTRGDHAMLDDLPRAKREHARRFAPKPILTAPRAVPSGLVNAWTMRAFNELWFRKSPKQHRGLEPISWFFHPLDDVMAEWNRMYGSRGFIQYQFVVPFGAESAVRTAVERLSGAGVASFLAVLKRFGRQNPGMLSFPAPGWTLALDIPVGDPSLAGLLDKLDDVVLEAGGRVYLAKDARVRPENLERMYPRLPEWRQVRDRLDPDHVFRSDLARRLGL